MTAADTLRGAATRLRGQIDKLTTDTTRWDEAFPSTRVYADQSTYERLIFHPDIGAKLADLLDSVDEHVGSFDCEAHCEPDGCGITRTALDLARAVLREEA